LAGCRQYAFDATGLRRQNDGQFSGLIRPVACGIVAMNYDLISDHIAYLQIALDRPLNASKRADGWTEESCLALINTLFTLKTPLRYSVTIPRELLTRSLDHWGIICGDLYEGIKGLEDLLTGDTYVFFEKSAERE